MFTAIPINLLIFQTILNENNTTINLHQTQNAENLSKSIRSPILGQQLCSPNDSISKRSSIRPMGIKPIPIQGKDVSYLIIALINNHTI